MGTRCLRDRRDCEHLRPAGTCDPRTWQAGVVESPAPRGRRGGRIDRRRGRDPDADPAGVLRRRGLAAGRDPAHPAAIRRGHALPAPQRRSPLPLRSDRLGRRPPRRAAAAGLAQRPRAERLPGLDRAGVGAGDPPAFHRRRGVGRPVAGAAAVCGPQADRAPRAERAGRGGRAVLRALDVLPHDRLQGHVPGPAVVPVLRRPGRPADPHRLVHRAPALQHQHLPELEAGAALPHDRPQRRDQHPAGQHQPHPGLREDDVLPGPGPRPFRPVPDHRAGRERLGQLRQRDGIAGPRRPHVASCR